MTGTKAGVRKFPVQLSAAYQSRSSNSVILTSRHLSWKQPTCAELFVFHKIYFCQKLRKIFALSCSHY